MANLVFDIETVGVKFEELDPVIQKNFLKSAKTKEEEEEIKDRTGLAPVSGEVVAIALLNPETGKGRVYFQAPDGGAEDYEKDGVEYLVKTEKEILEAFWEDIKLYQTIISYNGRGFDAPFIIFRSMFHGIKPSKNIMPYRYGKDGHFDILDQLTFFGAFRRFSLEVICSFLGIKNPKDEGVSGLEVNELYGKKEYEKIAEYCMRDVYATAELYDKVKEYIK
jgi:DNA polymerase elongation subunit (family B)